VAVTPPYAPIRNAVIKQIPSGGSAPKPVTLDRTIVLDKACLLLPVRNGSEVYASDGLAFVPMPFAPKADDRALEVAVEGGTARIAVLDVHELRGTWPR
jgi:hypothetical protein